MSTYENWSVGVDEFEGYSGPFHLYDQLEAGGPPEFTVGPHDHCAGQPRLLPGELQGLRQLSIQPTGIDSCLQWYAIDIFVNDEGQAVAVMLDLFGP